MKMRSILRLSPGSTTIRPRLSRSGFLWEIWTCGENQTGKTSFGHSQWIGRHKEWCRLCDNYYQKCILQESMLYTWFLFSIVCPWLVEFTRKAWISLMLTAEYLSWEELVSCCKTCVEVLFYYEEFSAWCIFMSCFIGQLMTTKKLPWQPPFGHLCGTTIPAGEAHNHLCRLRRWGLSFSMFFYFILPC